VTPRERQFWLSVERKARELRPDLARAFLRGFENLRSELTDAQLQRLIEEGSIDRLLNEAFSEQKIDRAFGELREQVRASVYQAARATMRDMPRGSAVTFNSLNPRVIDGIRDLETRVMRTLREDIRESVRQHVTEGLREGVGSRATARGVRSVVGLAPNQEFAVRNFRRSLETGDIRKALEYRLRDRRFDRALAGELDAAKIDRMTEAYRKRMLAFHAETVTHTASLDAMKAGQRTSWLDAVEQGTVDRSRLRKRWVTVGDSRVRPEHDAMNKQEVGFDEPFSNGEMIPGESTYNCRCVAFVFVARVSKVA
jgi:uncharacterized protein with gpF-like domain